MQNNKNTVKLNNLKVNQNKFYWINHFENCISPPVLGKITVDEVLHKIKNGDENLLNIKNAREFGKSHQKYDEIKKTVLPTYRFNFIFEGYAKDIKIIESTGLIYIDVDDTIEIPHSDYIYAKWRSLSNKGYGILVKVDNLTLDNFKEVYTSLGMALGVKVDNGACKAIQQNVLSYDPYLYFNADSRVYQCKDIKKASLNNIKKKKECISVNEAFKDTFAIKERIDNSYEYFVGDNYDKDYLYFENKVTICAPYMPWNGVEKGNRNNFLFRVLSQFALLNPHLGRDYLFNKSIYFNKKMNPNLTKTEINSVITSVINKREEGSLKMYYNKERLILFNPNKKLTKSEKSKIKGMIVGAKRAKLTEDAIYEIIENWDFELFGKITQKSVIELNIFSRSTVQRYWSNFKKYVEELNEFNRNSIKLKKVA
jgi:hypothetical protein